MRWDKKDIPHKGWTEIGMEDLGEEAEFGEDKNTNDVKCVVTRKYDMCIL